MWWSEQVTARADADRLSAPAPAPAPHPATCSVAECAACPFRISPRAQSLRGRASANAGFSAPGDFSTTAIPHPLLTIAPAAPAEPIEPPTTSACNEHPGPARGRQDGAGRRAARDRGRPAPQARPRDESGELAERISRVRWVANRKHTAGSAHDHPPTHPPTHRHADPHVHASAGAPRACSRPSHPLAVLLDRGHRSMDGRPTGHRPRRPRLADGSLTPPGQHRGADHSDRGRVPRRDAHDRQRPQGLRELPQAAGHAPPPPRRRRGGAPVLGQQCREWTPCGCGRGCARCDALTLQKVQPVEHR